ncbi:MAG: carboxypeptidase regulatory-like domain-containing protein [Acidobacteria bacterium]|nr:carboxypeptidase regulatory-like domain-containing protein [Acidobacteriota bacterium]
MAVLRFLGAALLAIAFFTGLPARGEGGVTVRAQGDLLIARIPVSREGELCGTGQILDAKSFALWSGSARQTVPKGGVFELPIDVGLLSMPTAHQSDLTWYRLRHTVGPCGALPGPRIVSLSEALVDSFEIRARGPGVVYGQTVPIWVEAVSRDGRPLAGVGIEAEFAGSKGTAVTGEAGVAELAVAVPEGGVVHRGVEVTARYRGLARKVEVETYALWETKGLISTDKALYQRGQTLHVRALVLDGSRRPIAGRETTVRIEAPDRTVVLRREGTTAASGVVLADWEIPEDVSDGEYRVTLGPKDGGRDDVWSAAWVAVSRYELPTFTVTVKPEKPFTAPGERASVAISAAYLSGEPLRRFSVRVVKAESRWSWGRRRESSSDQPVAAGEAGADAAFHAVLELPDREMWYRGRFRDTPFEAAVTDSTTGRTERRRFDLRTSEEPIHVYLLGDPPRHPALDSDIYVSTFGADGTPASCRVSVAVDGRAVGSLQTNRFGVGKLVAPLPSGRLLTLEAEDAQGRRGRSEEDYWGPEGDRSEPALRVTVPSPILKRGRPLSVDLAASYEDGFAYLDVVGESGLLFWKTVPIRGGKGHYTFPYQKEFQGRVTVAAYSASGDWTRFVRAVGRRTVVYPEDRELVLTARLSKSSHRPGDSATARLTLKRRDGRPVAGHLGVTVVDRAVEERVADGEWEGDSSKGDPFTLPIRRLLELDEELAGFRVADLHRLATEKSVPPGVDLVAEALLNRWYGYWPEAATSTRTASFEDLLEMTLEPFRKELLVDGRRLPRTEAEVAARVSGIPLDPWDVTFRLEYHVDPPRDLLRVLSAGPDQSWGTPDDLVAAEYRVLSLVEEERALLDAMRRFGERTGKALLDAEDLIAEAGFEIDALRDRLGGRVTLEMLPTKDGLTARLFSEDCLTLADARMDFNSAIVARVRLAAETYKRLRGCPPGSDGELTEALAYLGEGPLRGDPLGRAWSAGFRVEPESIQLSTLEKDGRRFSRRVTQDAEVLRLTSSGLDGALGTSDDFVVKDVRVPGQRREVVGPFEPESAAAPKPVKPPDAPPLPASIRGAVTDDSGQQLPGVEVLCKSETSGTRETAITRADGTYVFRGLADGSYTLVFSLTGFLTVERRGVRVTSGSETVVEVSLALAIVTEGITVTAESPAVQTASTATAAAAKDGPAGKAVPAPAPRSPMGTPRVRKNFPETLLWRPELETNADGRLKLTFDLADNITTWSLFAVASTDDGSVGFTRTDFTAFQPFFVDHDPPRILTVGDEIGLPVVVRNYQKREQRVALSMEPDIWFHLLGGARQELTVAAGDSKVERFRFRAARAIALGEQRVTALGLGEPGKAQPSDAITKPVTVHENAEEKHVSEGGLLRGDLRLVVDVPPEALTGTAMATLTVYPNVLAQVVDGLESMVERPHGCAEQTVSLANASLLALRSLRAAGRSKPDLEARALGYVRSGVEKVTAFSSPSGGIAYFEGGAPDVALTAYALTFLADASRLVRVDETFLRANVAWLVRAQGTNGSFVPSASSPRGLATTALAARALAKQTVETPGAASALKVALAHLEDASRKSSGLGDGEAYFCAAFALAAEEAGEPERAEVARARLRALARTDRGETSWPHDSTSPFHTWGRAGAIEVTALAAQALLRTGRDRELADSALLFLLRRREATGLWFSGHATIRVLEALLGGFPEGELGTVRILVNGTPLDDLQPASGERVLDPISVELSKVLRAGPNEVLLTTAGSGSAAAHLTLRYRAPWNGGTPSPDLALRVTYDATEAAVGQTITASVSAERTSERGRGMLLVEVGLPPGADVDRARLSELVRSFHDGVYQYEVQPDRVVFYVWPLWGDKPRSVFSFRFRPRYPIRALTAPSTLTDFYNPDARVTIPPARFTVK